MQVKSRHWCIEAEQWFPGKAVPGVTECFAYVGDGQQTPLGHGFAAGCSGEPFGHVNPGDWVLYDPHGFVCKILSSERFKALYQMAPADAVAARLEEVSHGLHQLVTRLDALLAHREPGPQAALPCGTHTLAPEVPS